MRRNIPYTSKIYWRDHRSGYGRYAGFVSEDPDKSTTIYRRFETLTARSLLYLESELSELEQQQEMFDNCVDIEGDKEVIAEMVRASHSWKLLQEQRTGSEVRGVQAAATRRVDLVLETRSKLKEYRMCLLFVSHRIVVG